MHKNRKSSSIPQKDLDLIEIKVAMSSGMVYSIRVDLGQPLLAQIQNNMDRHAVSRELSYMYEARTIQAQDTGHRLGLRPKDYIDAMMPIRTDKKMV